MLRTRARLCVMNKYRLPSALGMLPPNCCEQVLKAGQAA
jgi:hypothetical protein